MLLLLLVSYISAQHYHIVPNDSKSKCRSYHVGTCFTLAEFTNNSSHLAQHNNLTLSFFPGEHLLTNRIIIAGPQNIVLNGQNSSNNNCTHTIKCQGTSGFEFGDIQILQIAYLKFTGCGNVLFGGAISINKSDRVLVKGCHFIDNHVTKEGGAIHVRNTEVMKIESSFFNHNSASKHISGRNANGGAISINNGFIFSINNNYSDNSAVYGGAISVEYGNISSTSDSYIGSSAGFAGGAIYVWSGSIFSTHVQYIKNSAFNSGGAIRVSSGNIYSSKDYYTSNRADWGGAMDVRSGSIHSTSNRYINNSAKKSGGAIYVYSCNIISTEDYYISNSAGNGGAIRVISGNILSSCDHYINNLAEDGGAIYVSHGRLRCSSDYYVNNSAESNGGALNIYTGSISSFSVKYINNNAADTGGAIYVYSGIVHSTGNNFVNNSADAGGAINIMLSGNISTTGDHFTSNSAGYYGGAIFMNAGSCKLSNNSFKHNTAFEGAVICKTKGTLHIAQTNITHNFASSKGNVYLDTVTLLIAEGVNFINNHGSLYISSTKVNINGTVAFMNNLGDFGGAITAIQQSQITFNTTSSVTIHNNTATNGGGIYLAQSNLHVYHPFELTDNRATEYGGGIYASRGEIEFTSDSDLEPTQIIQISNNTALSGGALCAIASSIHISKTYVYFNSNRALMNGGAMYLGRYSKIRLLKNVPEYVRDDNFYVRLEFTSNSAEKGGAIYVADSNNDGVLCQGVNKEINVEECFLQTLSTYTRITRKGLTFINTFFTNNTAQKSGGDIYGGLLDQCTINQLAELAIWFPGYSVLNMSGFNYIKATTQIEHIVDYNQYARTHPDYLVKNISTRDVMGLISSNGILEFCLDNILSPNYEHSSVEINKGELFTVSLAAVDQVGNLVNATVTSTLSSESGNGHFNGGQVEQQVKPLCTKLEYNVYSQDNSSQMYLYLYSDGPCGSMEVSKLTLNLTFLPCECPVGFEPSSSKTECICQCDKRLMQHHITKCFIKSGTVQLETNIWIGVANYTNETGFVIHDCPYDYCVQKPVNISLSSPDRVHQQCAYNRSGSLCGMCKDLSLVFGSSRCEECSNYFIFLLIPFALAGIVLVAFILLLNITVATGTIHGQIFYANILTTNKSFFLPFATPNFLTVFISWLNLDLGIETCFYNGMNSYSKFLLQLAFPTYVFILIGTIIVLCQVSKTFSTLLGNRNPIAALCTLILLSYSKLIHTIITALQFTYFDFPNGSREIVWLYDANIDYFTLSHIPRFIAAFIILIFGSIYTILLLFGQWFPYCSNQKLMTWTKNTKYIAFIDAYHAPFTPRHRYWMGLLLFAITTHSIVAAMATDDTVPILSAGCIALGLILLKLLSTTIYKNKLQDSLETLFLANIAVLTVVTFYIRETNGNQLALANTSMAISFILFFIIFGYHIYKYILNGTRAWARVIRCCQRREHARNRHQMYFFPPEEDDEPLLKQDTLDSNSQLREPALDIIDPVYTDHYRDPPRSPVIQQPPNITYAVIDVRPGHRDGPFPCGTEEQNE